MKPKYPLGTVTESLAGARFRVAMDEGQEVICYLAGKMRIRKISIQVGDRVEVILDPAGGKSTNRIVWRH